MAPPHPSAMPPASHSTHDHEPSPEHDPLALPNVEAAMAKRESATGRAARAKIMAAIDDEEQCKELVGTLRRIMREDGGG